MSRPRSIPGPAAGRGRVLALAGTIALFASAGVADDLAACRAIGPDHAHENDDLSQLGTPFALIGGDGGVVTSDSLFDRPALVYFGYAFCPDICPVDTVRNADAIDLLAEGGIDVRPVFVTVDPGRDTAEVIGEYSRALHPEMVGLTGTIEQISAVADAYGVVFTTDDAASGDPYYLVGHSTFSYLVLPEQGVVDRISRAATAEEVVARVACVIEAVE